ncbi:MAG: metallophosphoesterase [Peptococcaceae bacterium]|nr:metallophosphoesterase [Peptococcaceae bacterium]
MRQAGRLVVSHKVISTIVPVGAASLGWADYETKDLTLHKLRLELPNWPHQLNGYKIVQLSDLHLETLHIKLKAITELANSQKPDLLVITGDIATARSDLNHVTQALAPLQAKDARIAVMGNNDYAHFSHTQFDEYLRHIASLGIRVLINEAVKVTSGTHAYWVVGVDDPATAHDNVPLAFAQVPNDGLPRLVLAHSTDCIDGLYNRKVDLFLTGHTHGGQIVLPLIGAPIRNTLLAEEGIYAGYHVINGIRVYINVGIGTSGIPLRIGVKPEIAVFELYQKTV